MTDAHDEALRSFLRDQSTNEDDVALRRYLGADTKPGPSEEFVRTLLPPSRKATGTDWKAARRDAET